MDYHTEWLCGFSGVTEIQTTNNYFNLKNSVQCTIWTQEPLGGNANSVNYIFFILFVYMATEEEPIFNLFFFLSTNIQMCMVGNSSFLPPSLSLPTGRLPLWKKWQEENKIAPIVSCGRSHRRVPWGHAAACTCGKEMCISYALDIHVIQYITPMCQKSTELADCQIVHAQTHTIIEPVLGRGPVLSGFTFQLSNEQYVGMWIGANAIGQTPLL